MQIYILTHTHRYTYYCNGLRLLLSLPLHINTTGHGRPIQQLYFNYYLLIEHKV